MDNDIKRLLEEQNRLLAEQNRIARAQLEKTPKKKDPWVCGSWPRCYHGAVIGGIFGCYGVR